MRKSVILYLTLVIFSMPLTSMSLEWKGQYGMEDYLADPQIKDFSMIQEDKIIKLSFSFSGVAGGIEKATFIIGATVYRNYIAYGTTVQITEFNLESDEYEIISEDGSIENGRVESKIPILEDDILKSGDTVVYRIIIIDMRNKFSNEIYYEFIFKKPMIA